MDAIKKGDLEEFRDCIKLRITRQQIFYLMNCQDQLGYNLIHQCVYFGQHKILIYMIDYMKQIYKGLIKSNNKNIN